jgi:hypothetical protein
MFRSMFQSQEEEPAGRYRTGIIEGHMRKQSHQAEVYECLNKGEQQGWRLVSASTSNPVGTYFTSLYWDTSQER